MSGNDPGLHAFPDLVHPDRRSGAATAMTPERNPTIKALFAVPEIPPPEDDDRAYRGRPGEAAGIMQRYRKASAARKLRQRLDELAKHES